MKHSDIFRLISGALLLNNLVGIILNAELAFSSLLLLGGGLPGFIFAFLYGAWCFMCQIEPNKYYSRLCLQMIIYNAGVLCLLRTFHNHIAQADLFNSYYPEIFPSVNLAVCVLLLILSFTRPLHVTDGQVLENILPPEPVHNDDPGRWSGHRIIFLIVNLLLLLILVLILQFFIRIL